MIENRQSYSKESRVQFFWPTLYVIFDFTFLSHFKHVKLEMPSYFQIVALTDSRQLSLKIASYCSDQICNKLHHLRTELITANGILSSVRMHNTAKEQKETKCFTNKTPKQQLHLMMTIIIIIIIINNQSHHCMLGKEIVRDETVGYNTHQILCNSILNMTSQTTT